MFEVWEEILNVNFMIEKMTTAEKIRAVQKSPEILRALDLLISTFNDCELRGYIRFTYIIDEIKYEINFMPILNEVIYEDMGDGEEKNLKK